MVETLQEKLKKKICENGKTEDIALYLNREESDKLLKLAQDKINRCAWVIEHVDEWKKPEDEKERIKKSAKESAGFWEKIAMKIESQLN